jgi:hypothetical protein
MVAMLGAYQVPPGYLVELRDQRGSGWRDSKRH